MARIWCGSAAVHLKEPMKVPGYPDSKDIRVPVKVRTEGEPAPSDEAILQEARQVMEACYTAEVVSVDKPIVDFVLWDNV